MISAITEENDIRALSASLCSLLNTAISQLDDITSPIGQDRIVVCIFIGILHIGIKKIYKFVIFARGVLVFLWGRFADKFEMS